MKPQLLGDGATETTLSQAAVGGELKIVGLRGAACRRLRELGFCEDLSLCKLSDGRNLLCNVCGTRLVLSKKLAEDVLVSANSVAGN